MKSGNVLVWGLATSVAVALAPGAAAPAPSKPAISQEVSSAGPVTTIPLPDILMKIETDGTIMIQNIGDANVTKPFGVDVR